MIGNEHVSVADLLVHLHRLVHVHVAVVNEGLVEDGHLALDVAEVDVVDSVALAKVADDAENVHTGLLGKGPLADVEAVSGAVHDLNHLLHALEIGQDAGFAGEELGGRIVVVHRHEDPRLLGHRHDSLHEVGDVVPHFVGAHVHRIFGPLVSYEVLVEAGYLCPAPACGIGSGNAPEDIGD